MTTSGSLNTTRLGNGSVPVLARCIRTQVLQVAFVVSAASVSIVSLKRERNTQIGSHKKTKGGISVDPPSSRANMGKVFPPDPRQLSKSWLLFLLQYTNIFSLTHNYYSWHFLHQCVPRPPITVRSMTPPQLLGHF